MRFAWHEDSDRRKWEAMGGVAFPNRGNVFIDPLPSAEMLKLSKARQAAKAKRRRKRNKRRNRKGRAA